MASTVFSPPQVLLFNVGFADSSAAVVAVNQAKKVKKQRTPIKCSFWKSMGQLAKAASRKSVLIQSSARRQGKFAEARSRNGDGVLPTQVRN
eukprot:c17853_g1_i1 orf=226-501(-)